MPSATPAGDPPIPSWMFPYGTYPLTDNTQIFPDPSRLEDIDNRLEKLERIMTQLDKEEKVREKNPFVQELYDQYKVALALLEDPDE